MTVSVYSQHSVRDLCTVSRIIETVTISDDLPEVAGCDLAVFSRDSGFKLVEAAFIVGHLYCVIVFHVEGLTYLKNRDKLIQVETQQLVKLWLPGFKCLVSQTGEKLMNTVGLGKK